MSNHVFTPFIGLTVEDGRVTRVSIDWSDSYQGEDGSLGPDMVTEDGFKACFFMDNPRLRRAVERAIDDVIQEEAYRAA